MCFSRFKNASRRDRGILNVELGFQCQHRLTSVVPYSSWSPAQLRSESELGRGVVIVGRSPLHATPLTRIRLLKLCANQASGKWVPAFTQSHSCNINNRWPYNGYESQRLLDQS